MSDRLAISMADAVAPSDSRTSNRSARTVAGATLIEIGMEPHLSPAQVDLLRAEADRAMSAPVAGALSLFDAHVDERVVALRTAPVPSDAIRLDALFAAFAAWRSPLGSAISAYVVCRLADAIASIHRADHVPPIIDRAGVL